MAVLDAYALLKGWKLDYVLIDLKVLSWNWGSSNCKMMWKYEIKINLISQTLEIVNWIIMLSQSFWSGIRQGKFLPWSSLKELDTSKMCLIRLYGSPAAKIKFITQNQKCSTHQIEIEMHARDIHVSHQSISHRLKCIKISCTIKWYLFVFPNCRSISQNIRMVFWTMIKIGYRYGHPNLEFW